jgi:hypothetical protein
VRRPWHRPARATRSAGSYDVTSAARQGGPIPGAGEQLQLSAAPVLSAQSRSAGGWDEFLQHFLEGRDARAGAASDAQAPQLGDAVLPDRTRAVGECLEAVVELPVACPTSVAFGGEDLGDLYITSMTPRGAPGPDPRTPVLMWDPRPLEGALFRCQPRVAGRSPHVFRG